MRQPSSQCWLCFLTSPHQFHDNKQMLITCKFSRCLPNAQTLAGGHKGCLNNMQFYFFASFSLLLSLEIAGVFKSSDGKKQIFHEQNSKCIFFFKHPFSLLRIYSLILKGYSATLDESLFVQAEESLQVQLVSIKLTCLLHLFQMSSCSHRMIFLSMVVCQI